MEYNELIKKARECVDKKDYSEAVAIYKMAFENNISAVDYADLIYCYLELGELDKALEAIKNYLESTNGHAVGYYYYGEYYVKKDDYLNAISKFKIALRKGQKEAIYKIALCYQELSENNKKYLNKAIKFFKMNIKENGYDFDTYYNISLVYEDKKMYKEALSYALYAYNKNSDYPDIAFNVGIIYQHLRKYDEMEKYYLLETNNENPSYGAFYNLGLHYKDIKNYDKSQEYYIKGLGYCKSDYRLWFNLGCLYSITGEYQKATDCFYCSYLINDKTIDYLSEDEETKEYIKTQYFQELKEKTKRQ